MYTLKTTLIRLLLSGAAVISSAAHAGATFDAVKQKGYVQCGVSAGMAGASTYRGGVRNTRN